MQRAFLLVVFAFSLSVASRAGAMSPRDIYQKSGAAVVLILSSDDGKTGSGGTGSIITKDGKVVTNAHVILNASGQPYKTTYVFLKPAKVSGDNAQDLKLRYTATVKAYSPPAELDLAILQLENAPADPPTVQFGDPSDVNIGDPVVAVGHPEQGGLWTLTTGTVSTMIQNFDRIKGKHVFQTEASFNRGNSGGPLFDEYGNIIGINTMIARKAADGLAITAVNFSLKSSVAVDWLKTQQLTLAYATKPAGSEAVAANVAPNTAKQPEAKKPEAVATAAPPPAAKEAPPAAVEQPPPAEAKASNEVANKSAVPANDLPKNAKIETQKRPYSIDKLLKDQMKDLEDMMGEMSGKTKKKLGKKGF
ncbi:MAG: trypsin-like peptidase domain-containing protein [Deltaproteobacteria bacterium]|nr:trypsin-like peptidase domain-containing protein [Deltaproteobacteria bacterium]